MIVRGILNIISDDAEIDDDLINSGFVYLTKPNALHISKIFVKLLTEPIVQDIKFLNLINKILISIVSIFYFD